MSCCMHSFFGAVGSRKVYTRMAQDNISSIQQSISNLLNPYGYECSDPFRVGEYNKLVSGDFKLPFEDDILGFVIISNNKMFDNMLNLCRENNVHEDIIDPVDTCSKHYIGGLNQHFPEIDITYDFNINVLRRTAKVAMQTAGHVAGICYYYQPIHLPAETKYEKDLRVYGVSVHPKYGGWFAFRAVVIFKNEHCPTLKETSPVNIVETNEKKLELLNKYNFHWKDCSFRDVIPVSTDHMYSEAQKKYFSLTPGAERMKYLKELL